MNDEFQKQMIAEILAAQGEALGILAAAVAEQVDADLLAQAIQRRVDAASANPRAFPGGTVQIATRALDAVLLAARNQKESH